MKTHLRLIATIFFGFILSASLLSCKQQVEEERYILEANVLVDPDDNMDLTDIVAQDGIPFQEIEGLEIDSKIKTVWVELKLDPGLQGQEFVFAIRHIDSLFLYHDLGSGYVLADFSGEDVKMKDRKLKYGERPALVFEIPPSGVVYLKMVCSSFYSRSFRSLENLRVEPAEIFESRIEKGRYFHGIFLGVMVAMIIYNLFIYFMYRDSMYLVYTVFMVTQTFYHLSITGYLRELILPDLPFLAKYAPFVIAGISLMSYIWFSQVYLIAKKYAPRINNLLKILYAVITGTTVVGLFYKIELANSILLVCGLLVVAFPFVIAIIAYRQKYRPAFFFLIASVLSYIGYYLFTMQRFELLPNVFVTRYSFQMMFAAQSLLFALGLGDRMNRIKKELALGKIRQAELKQEKERALKEVLEKQNIELEKKVVERTKELVEKSKIVERDKETIQKERQKSEALLLNILPESIAERLKKGESKIADQFDDVSVFFSDIVGFTSLSKKMKPDDLINLLNDVFSEFDKLAEKHGLEKIKTIGDAYMCVSGLPIPLEDHATRMASFAIEANHSLSKLSFEKAIDVRFRMGIHCGPVVAGVIGNSKFAYDLWGETVNVASRLEAHGESTKIYCSEEFKTKIESNFELVSVGELELKGIGKRKVFELKT
ncbi:adenylate/guanylate cyclase domain-containing protein [Algoriphagus sediminis]|uniref:Adenylate/guanylate cyclase domain-containing protein n=1 Tax=Algoriphagus sediminis TaxID=3057113 RepID=A0ABT7Y908_9BACT|nr:adenylate/guanylate cyclase domain-containing protein [Algoriphagus sediminis]MDN3202975.1 adenylate/guanylate cyclase domain-containing protein [Algoriphagus sediminis]